MNVSRLMVSLYLLSAGLTFAQSTMTVAQLESFIKSSIQLHNPDKDVADSSSQDKIAE